jgi:hypothetical protein
LAISNRIRGIENSDEFSTDSFQIAEAENTIDILNLEGIILSVAENDALWNNKTKLELAIEYKQLIKEAVLKYEQEISIFSILIALSLAKKITEQEGKKINGVRIKNYTLFDAARMVKVILYDFHHY